MIISIGIILFAGAPFLLWALIYAGGLRKVKGWRQ